MRHLTSEENAAFQKAARARLGLEPEPCSDWRGLQDGMLAHYLSQARSSDANVEARIEREPFDFRDHASRVGKIEKAEPRPPIYPAEWLK